MDENRDTSIDERGRSQLGKTLGELHRYRDEILAAEVFEPEEALRLGGTYLSYRSDWLLLIESQPHPNESPKFNRMTEEAALGNAEKGNLAPLKEVLQSIGQEELEPARKGESSQRAEQRRAFGGKLLDIVSVLPDSGIRFIPPPPIGR